MTDIELPEAEGTDSPELQATFATVRLLEGGGLYRLPWGQDFIDANKTRSFTDREWAKRRLARKTAKDSRRRNRP